MVEDTLDNTQQFDLMEQADAYFQQHFEQLQINPDANYKIFLLQYIEYLLKDLQVDKIKELYNRQLGIVNHNEDIKLKETKIKLWINFMEAQTPEEKIKALNELDSYYREQEDMNARRQIIQKDAIRKREDIIKQRNLIEKQTIEIKLEIANAEKAEAETRTTKAENIALEAQTRTAEEIAERERVEKEASQEKAKTAQAKAEVAEQRTKNTLLGAIIVALFAIGAGWF